MRHLIDGIKCEVCSNRFCWHRITPLAIPVLAGPGAISTVLLLQNHAKTAVQHAALYGCIVGVSGATYLIFRLAVPGARWLMSIAIRIMGPLLSAMPSSFCSTASRRSARI